jgi:Tol biopolymer transport system component
MGMAAAEARPAAARGGGRRIAVGVLALLAVAAALAGGYLMGRGESDGEVPSFRRLTFKRGAIRSARVAPDGQTIVYGAAWDGEPIRIFTTRPDSPESRRLDLPDADILAISSKGEMAVSIGRTFLSPYQSTGTLARVALAGGAPRLVLENVQEADWSPDGEALAAVHEVDGANRLEFPIGTVLYETRGWISGPRVSPDGTRVAFLDHDLRWDNRGWLSVVDLQGKVTRLTTMSSNSDGLAWSRDGEEIWFAGSLDEMARGIYAVRLDGGMRKIYQQAAALTLFDLLPDGRALVGSTDMRRETHFGTGAEDRELSWLDWSLLCFLSRDGKWVILDEQGEGGKEGYSIYLRRTDGSAPVEVGVGIPFGLSPDGRWVLARAPEGEIVAYPTGPGSPRELVQEVKGRVWAGWFPDGRRILLATQGDQGASRLDVLDLDGGSRSLPHDDLILDAFSDPVAPDGKRAMARNLAGAVYVVPLDGGERTPVAAFEPGDVPVRWSDDGRFLWFYRQGMPAVYGRLEVATGRREVLGSLAPRDRAGAVGVWPALFSGDGKEHAYSFPRFQTSLYLVDGLR